MDITVTASWTCPQCDQAAVLVDERNLWECLVCSTKGHIDAAGTVWMQSPGWDDMKGGVR